MSANLFVNDHSLSTVTAVLPNRAAKEVAAQLILTDDTEALNWKARGTLLHDHWLKKWLPSISPAKNVMQMTVPDSAVDQIVDTVVQVGKLNYQATGAVFSTPHDHAYVGSKYTVWPGEEKPRNGSDALNKNLSVIYCIVNHAYSDRIARAAVRAGGHGPIVYFCEGKGLRDRLGWLRITKEHEKEVLMVISEESEADDIFDAMAKAGELNLPGHGFMFRLNIDKGLFNIPSLVAHHHHGASLQQIINAIDHLQGHSHWRDQSVVDVGQGRGVGVQVSQQVSELYNHHCLNAILPRSNMKALTDLLLDHGVPGLNFNYVRHLDGDRDEHEGPHFSEEYVLLRSVTDEETLANVCSAIDTHAAGLGLDDLCVTVDATDRIATYVPGPIKYRASDAA